MTTTSVTGAPIDAAVEQRWYAEAWPTEAAHLRSNAPIAIAASFCLGPFDWSFHGTGPLWQALYVVHVLAALTMVPVYVAGRAATRPSMLLRTLLIADSATTGSILMSLAFAPTTVSVHGWCMLCTLAVASFSLNIPLRPKLVAHAGASAVFAIIVIRCSITRGAAYGSLAEIIAVVAGTTLVGMNLPLIPHRIREHRLREQIARIRLEEEIKLRKYRLT